jgi:ADP-ribose pyrophosphatase YjhB (NUDIX family)
VGAKHSVSVAAVVVNEEGQILVTQRRDNGHWEPPGGVLELNETIIDCVKREVREETGYEIEPDQMTGVYKNLSRGIVALVFRAHVTGGHRSLSEETSHVEWWDPEQILANMDEAYAIRVSDALTGRGTAVRVHNGVTVIHET